MVRHTMTGTDDRTKIVLDLDPARVKVLDGNTLSVKPPKSWTLDSRPAKVSVLELVHDWFHHEDGVLDAVGIKIVEVTEDGQPLARGSAPQD